MLVACDSKIAFGAKHVATGNEACGAWIRAVAWAARHSVDGFVPRAAAHAIAPKKVWTRLVQATAGGDTGLAAECDGGYVLQSGFARTPAPDSGTWSRSSYATVYERDGRACRYCGSTQDLTIDHVVPRCQGGGDEADNLVVACRSCNSRKGGRTPDEAGMTLLHAAGGA
jgi:hypothetical protein